MHKSTTFIVGNWKMHGNAALAAELAGAIAGRVPANTEVVLCPPFTLLTAAGSAIAAGHIKLGAQDCHEAKEGAFTGDVSASMLREAGCAYVIVGHSERRAGHRETNEVVQKKAAQAMACGLIPIICIGETEAERARGAAQDVVAAQLAESLPKEAASHDFLLAYEPVWAIGSGKTPTVGDIAAMHSHIISVAGPQARVLYGGSVKAANALEILETPGVAGVLVGGASLKAEEFSGIIAAAAALKKG